MMEGLLEALSAGGDVATMGLVIALWRLDRRLLIVETTLKGEKND